MLVAAHCNLGDLGPVVVELGFNGYQWITTCNEFDTNEEAIEYWSSLDLNGELVWDEGRLFIGAPYRAMDLSLDENLGQIGFLFGDTKESQLKFIAPSDFLVENVPGFMFPFTGKSQETQEQTENIQAIA